MTNSRAIKKGIKFRVKSATVEPVHEQTVYRTVPTGGVMAPTQRLITKTIPKCTRSTPNCCIIGARIGVNIIRREVASKIVPITSRAMLIIIRITYGFCDMPKRVVMTV